MRPPGDRNKDAVIDGRSLLLLTNPKMENEVVLAAKTNIGLFVFQPCSEKIIGCKFYLYTKKMPFDGTEIQPFYPESDNSHETLRIFYPCQVFQKGNALSEKH